MNRKGKVFLIAILSLFFLCGAVFAEYSNDVPTPTVIAPPKTSTPPPAPTPPPLAPKKPEQPRIKVTVPHISDDYETTTPTLTGANVIIRVFESGTKKAISGAMVKWYSVKYATGGVTDGRGEARIGQVMPGEAKITASARGYESNSKTVRAKSSTKVQYFDIYLNKTARITPSPETPPTVTTTPPVDTEKKVSISGTVYDKATKSPIAGASVKLAGTGPGQNVINEASSDGNGRYAITGCPLGVAVKLIYSKESYNKEEMTRYIAKTTASYRQDAYLGKGAVEAKKPKREVETLKSGPRIHETDLELISVEVNGTPITSFGRLTMELPADNTIELKAQARNNGTDQTPGMSILSLVVADMSDINNTNIDNIPVDLQGPPNRIVEDARTYPIQPGTYIVGAYVNPNWDNPNEEPSNDPDPSNNTIECTVEFVRAASHNTDLEAVRFVANGQDIPNDSYITIELPADNNVEVKVQARNNGPDEASAMPALSIERVGETGGDVDEFSLDLQGPPNRIVEQLQTYVMSPGTYRFEANIRPGDGPDPATRDNDPDIDNNSIGGMVELVSRQAGVPHNTDLAITRLTMNNQPLHDNPVFRLNLDNQNLDFMLSMKNNGPDDGTGPAKVFLYFEGTNGGPLEIDLSRVGNSLDIPSDLRGFPEGTYALGVELAVPYGDTDPDLSNNTDSGNITIIYENIPGRGEPEHDEQEPREKADIELMSFIVEGQPVNDNPNIAFPADNRPPQFSMLMRNNGPADVTESTVVQIMKDGVFTCAVGEIDLIPGGEIISRSVPIAGITAGPHTFKAMLGVPFGNDDDNLSNNSISGTVTFGAGAEPAGVGPDGGQPDGGQPDGGQPDNGQPDRGQPGGGPGGRGPGGAGPGGWNPPDGAGPRGAGPIVPAIPPQVDAGMFGGGVPQEIPMPVGVAEAPGIDTIQSSPVVHPTMGPGPEFVKEFFGQVLAGKKPEAKEEEKAEEKPAAGKEKNKILWLIAILSGMGLLIILAVIAKKKKSKKELR